MSKIFTVTLNTAVDRVIELETLDVGGVSEALNHLEIAAGKGINVSRALAANDIASAAYCFSGGRDKELFRGLESKFIQPVVFAVDGQTRSNITLIENNPRRATHVKTSGYTVTSSAILSMTNALAKEVSGKDVVVVSGSLPHGFSNGDLRSFLGTITHAGPRLILDLAAANYSAGLEFRPFAIKPNLEELSEFAGRPIRTQRQIIDVAKELIARGPQVVLITLGAEGVIAVADNGTVALRASIPESKRISKDDAVGSGDAFVAGFIESVSVGEPLANCLMNACAYGAANQASTIPAEINRQEVLRYSSLVEVTKLDV